MMKLTTLSIIMLGCVTLYSMEQKDFEKNIATIFQQTNILADSMAKNNPSIEQWITLMKNCGKLEAALEYNLIKNEKERGDISQGITHLEEAFKFHLRTNEKKVGLSILEIFNKALEEEQEH